MLVLKVWVKGYIFGFDSFDDWCNSAKQRYKGYSLERTIAIDQMNRVCSSGAEFMRARDDGAFPVVVYELL